MSEAFFRTLARDAAARYKPAGRFAYHFALGKLTGDPAFAYVLANGLVPKGARIVDLGCGQGLLAALLEAARHPVAAYRGIDLQERDIERARKAVGGHARFVRGDIRSEALEPADVAVILDVLHYIPYQAQEDLLQRVRAALSGGGVVLLRVGDESPTFRFRYTVAIDRIVMALRGHRLERLYCRPLAAWIALLEKLGFAVAATPMSAGTPFANVLLVARYDSPGGE